MRLLVEGRESLRLRHRLRFLHHTLGILTLHDSPIVLPSRDLLDTLRLVTHDGVCPEL
jgi:hypothetical protein